MGYNDIDLDTIERRPTSREGEYEAEIGGYTIDLDISNSGSKQCHIHWNGYTSSLECLRATGALVNTFDVEHKVPPALIGLIENWAYRNGY